MSGGSQNKDISGRKADLEADGMFMMSLSQFRDEAKTPDGKPREFHKWNSTSIGLTSAVLTYLSKYDPESPARTYAQQLLTEFLAWYDFRADNAWWSWICCNPRRYGVPVYLTFPGTPYCVDRAREIVNQAKTSTHHKQK